MPKVRQAHLDARRQQIVDAARVRFASQGFAGTSMADVVTESGLSIGAIYRYFRSKDEIMIAVCRQADDALPRSLTPEAVAAFLSRLRALSAENGHARLTTQIYAEAAVSPALAIVLQAQLAEVREQIAALIRAHRPGLDPERAEQTAEGFIAVCNGYHSQLAVRGDVDPAPFTAALLAVVGPAVAEKAVVEKVAPA